jgi:hypothetical protein
MAKVSIRFDLYLECLLQKEAQNQIVNSDIIEYESHQTPVRSKHKANKSD